MTAKLKDGLWIGDAQSAQDHDFIDKQCITYFINCGASSETRRQFPNHRHDRRHIQPPLPPPSPPTTAAAAITSNHHRRPPSTTTI